MFDLKLDDANTKRRLAYKLDGGKRRKYNNKWKKANIELVRRREKDRARYRALTMEGYRALWLNGIKYRAKQKGLPFNLTLEDLPVPERCPVLGIPLFMRSGPFHDNSPSIDRLVPGKGYVKGNVAIVSYRANRIKDYGTLDELRKVVAYLEQHLG
jgi:hypothetical protein